MKRYSFIFEGGSPRKLERLISYLEKEYGVEYLEIREFNSTFSLSLSVLGINIGNFKEIVFNKKDAKIKYGCNNCNFSIEKDKGLKFYKDNAKCKNCGHTIKYLDRHNKWIYFKNGLKLIL